MACNQITNHFIGFYFLQTTPRSRFVHLLFLWDHLFTVLADLLSQHHNLQPIALINLYWFFTFAQRTANCLRSNLNLCNIIRQTWIWRLRTVLGKLSKSISRTRNNSPVWSCISKKPPSLPWVVRNWAKREKLVDTSEKCEQIIRATLFDCYLSYREWYYSAIWH